MPCAAAQHSPPPFQPSNKHSVLQLCQGTDEAFHVGLSYSKCKGTRMREQQEHEGVSRAPVTPNVP